MISLFKIMYAFVEDKIILKRSWSETRERITGYAKEDPIFKVVKRLPKRLHGLTKVFARIMIVDNVLIDYV